MTPHESGTAMILIQVTSLRAQGNNPPRERHVVAL